MLLFNKDSFAIVNGTNYRAVQAMLDFDYLSSRSPSVKAVVTSGEGGFLKCFFGAKEIMIPLYPSIPAACKGNEEASVFINYASYRSAFESSMDALSQQSIKVVAIIAEGIPENQERKLIAEAKKLNKVIIGPATVGGVRAGEFRIGETGGTAENILRSKLYSRNGCVGLVSKSGGLLNEMMSIIAKNSSGVVEAIAIGGDRFSGSTLLEHVLRYEKDSSIRMIVVLGEVGGTDELEVAKAIQERKVVKPVVAFTIGISAEKFGKQVQFGHAGAKSNSEEETASFKNNAFRKAGATVPKSFHDYPEKIQEVFENLVKEKKVSVMEERAPELLAMDFDKAVKEGMVRKQTSIVSSIVDERGEEAKYCGFPQSKLIEEGCGVGEVVSLLWLKKRLDKRHAKFFDLCIILLADHGPSVSGAHNSIVASRAGKDLVSSLCSGLLTIGPRFGGAIDEAARNWLKCVREGKSPESFVEEEKVAGRKIAGIGHRVKSIYDPDKRVKLLKEFAEKNLGYSKHLDFALNVEKNTTSKKANLILNVDGTIAAILLDLLYDSGKFSEEEVEEIVSNGVFNAVFILARSIGLMAHAIDQKRLKQPLYRHDSNDTLYL